MATNAAPNASPNASPNAAPNSEAIEALFRLLPFLAEKQKDSELLYILEGVVSRDFAPGEPLFRPGKRVENVFLIVSGDVEEVRAHSAARPVLVRESTAGRLLGIYDLLTDQRHSTGARARTACKVVVFSANQINRLLFRFPDLRNRLMPFERMSRLRSIPLVAKLDLTALGFLAEACAEESWPAGTQVYAAGATAGNVYLVDEGQVRLEREEGERLWMGNGGEFGFNEHAARVAPGAVYTLDHSATAVTPVKAFSVPRRQFIAIAGLSPEERGKQLREDRRKALDQVRVFADYSVEEKQRLLGYMSYYFIPTTHLLTQQDELEDSLWLLLYGGRAKVYAVGADDRALPDIGAEGPTYFGETSLRGPSPAPSTLEAESGSSWLRLQWEDFHRFIQDMGDASLDDRLQLIAAPPSPGKPSPFRRFDWQEDGEGIVFMARRHWIVLVGKLTTAIITSILFGWAVAAITLLDATSAWLSVWLSALAGLFGAVALVAWAWGIADYLNDYLVVTTLRVFRQEKVIFLRELRQTAELDQIQNVDVQSGFWGKRLGYANVTVRTSSTFGAIGLDRMGKPDLVNENINRLREVRRRHRQAVGRKTIFNLLESRYGLTLTLPGRVWPGRRAADAATPASPWQRLRARLRLTPRAASAAQDRIVWRKHPIVLLRKLSLPTIILIALLTAVLLIYYLRFAGQLTGVVAFIPIVLTIFLILWMLWQLEDWRNDLYILERNQVIDIERKPLGLSEKRRTARLNQIVDLSLDMPTVFHHIFKFGNVVLQTSAREGKFTFDSVSDPRSVIEVVRQRIDGIRRAEEDAAARQRVSELPDWFDISDRLQGSPRSRADAEQLP